MWVSIENGYSFKRVNAEESLNIKSRLAAFSSKRRVICISITYLNIYLPRPVQFKFAPEADITLPPQTLVALIIRNRVSTRVNAEFALWITLRRNN